MIRDITLGQYYQAELDNSQAGSQSQDDRNSDLHNNAVHI